MMYVAPRWNFAPSQSNQDQLQHKPIVACSSRPTPKLHREESPHPMARRFQPCRNSPDTPRSTPMRQPPANVPYKPGSPKHALRPRCAPASNPIRFPCLKAQNISAPAPQSPRATEIQCHTSAIRYARRDINTLSVSPAIFHGSRSHGVGMIRVVIPLIPVGPNMRYIIVHPISWGQTPHIVTPCFAASQL